MIPRESNDKLCEFNKRWKLDGDYLRCVGCAKAAGVKLTNGRPIIASRDGFPFQHADGCENASSRHPWTELRSLIVAVAVGAQIGNTNAHVEVARECDRLGAFYVGNTTFSCQRRETQ